MNDDGLGLLDKLLPLLRVTLDDLVRVEFVRHGCHAQVGLQARLVPQQAARVEADLAFAVEGLAGGIQPAQHGGLTGGVRVEGQHDAAAETLEQAQLAFGQRGAHRRDDVLEAGLVQGDHVHVALDDDRLVSRADGLARPIQAVEQAALAEENRIRRVEELGHIVGIEDARPEAGHAALLVADGNHYSMSESIVGA